MPHILTFECPYSGLEQISKATLLLDPCAIRYMLANEMIAQTDSSTLWLTDGDHSWKDDPSIWESRYYSAEYSHVIRRSGDTECTHGMGTADLLYNLGRVKDFGSIFAAFVGLNHDRVENNRGIVIAEDIVETCWLGDPLLKQPLIWALNGISDFPNLHGYKRLYAQVVVANQDPTGFLGEVRILEKLEAENRDLLNARIGYAPFRGNWKKAKAYIQMRMEIVNAIHSPHSGPHKRVFMATALELTKELRKMECAKKHKPTPPALVEALIDKGIGTFSPRLAAHANLIITP